MKSPESPPPSDGGPDDDECRRDARDASQGPLLPGEGGPEGRSPGDDAFRRRMVEEALVSVQLREAIEVILRYYRQRGYRWDELLADTGEVRNEVALRALDCLSSFDPRRAAPLSWLMGIANNVLRERRRWYAREGQHRVSQSSCCEEQWQDILNQLSTEPHPAAEPGLVWEALRQLSPEQQRLLRLRYVEDRPYAEIAHFLRISEEAVRARVCRALHTLRDYLTNLERRNGQ
jgi:RNA polymerase sigma factor (sigma-70 family)